MVVPLSDAKLMTPPAPGWSIGGRCSAHQEDPAEVDVEDGRHSSRSERHRSTSHRTRYATLFYQDRTCSSANNSTDPTPVSVGDGSGRTAPPRAANRAISLSAERSAVACTGVRPAGLLGRIVRFVRRYRRPQLLRVSQSGRCVEVQLQGRDPRRISHAVRPGRARGAAS